MAVPEALKQEIEQKGKITFARFMEMALYHPDWGYYNLAKDKIGRKGDYYTSPDLHPAFGRTLASALAEMAGYLDGEIYIIEFGPGRGKMAAQILEKTQESYPDFYRRVKYCLIEISPYHRRLQKQYLQKWGDKLLWTDSLQELQKDFPIKACIISNEFPDALPVHRIKREGDVFREIFVTIKDGFLVEEMGRISDTAINEFIKLAGMELADGQTVEINLAMLAWLQEIDKLLAQGFILTIDYGYLSEQLRAPHRFDGTLLAYRGHTVVAYPYQAVGQQDLTAHVNFSALIKQGEALNWRTLCFMPQNKFLTGAGILQEIDNLQKGESYKEKLQGIKNLLMPEGVGETFKVLVQSKGVFNADLKCLKGWKS